MTKTCMSIQELLAATGGETRGLTSDERAHLDACVECSAVRENELRLARLLETALPPEEPGFEDSVMAALEPRRRWRVLALVPAAAALLLTLAGTFLLGGMPGSGLVAHVPAWSSHGWLALVAAGRDWVIAVGAASRAVALLPPLVPVAAVAVSLLGLLMVLRVARRWRTASDAGGR